MFGIKEIYYVFAIYMGNSPYIPNKLLQVSVCKLVKSWTVQYGKVRKIYSSLDSILSEWDVIYFDGTQ